MAKDIIDLCTLTDNIISGDINEYSMTIYGEGGSGKSTFANALKRKMGSSASFFFEPRSKGLGGIKVVEVSNWQMFIDYIKQLRKYKKAGKSVPFNNIIIDSTDSAYEKCTQWMFNENPDWNDTLKGDYGARYVAVGTEFKKAIDELRSLGYIVTFVTHEKTKEAKDINNAAFDKAIPIVPSQIQDIVKDHVDFIFYLQKISEEIEGERIEKRRLWMKNNPSIDLKTPLFGLPDYIDYDTANEGVEKFIEAFNHAVIVTRKMYEDGDDISNPNYLNNRVPEITQPVQTNFSDLKEDPLPDFEEPKTKPAVKESEVDIDELREQVKKTRDIMLKTMKASEVKDIMRAELGFVQVSKVSDANKLQEFINKHN